jgi:hypothetical protein
VVLLTLAWRHHEDLFQGCFFKRETEEKGNNFFGMKVAIY